MLASNVRNEIKQNTPGDFSVPLPIPLNLKDYEVGVSQISYPCSLVNISAEDANFRFEVDDGEDDGDSEVIDFNIPPGQYEEINGLIAKLNFQTMEYTPKRITFSYWKELDFVRCSIVVEKNSRFTLKLGENLLYILGFRENKVFNVRNFTTKKTNASKTKFTYTFEASHHPDLFAHSFCFFVYSNIVKPIIFSNVYAPLIFYSTYTGKSGEYNHERVREILYRPVDINFIQEIGIEIRQSNGFLVDFKWGTVFILLHFKKRELKLWNKKKSNEFVDCLLVEIKDFSYNI